MKINDLYKQAMAGEDGAETRLFASLSDRFRLFAYRRLWDHEEAEDLAQAALAIVAKEYRNLDVETSFSAWAHKVMDNRLLGFVQRQIRQKGRFSSQEADETESSGWAPDPTLRSKLLDCLKKVGHANRRYARIINLHYQGYVRDEICKMMNMSRDQSYVIMSRARSLLRNCLDTGKVE